MKALLGRVFADYGMAAVLVLLCVFFSYVTWTEQHPSGAAAAAQLARRIAANWPDGAQAVVVARTTPDDKAFAKALEAQLLDQGARVPAVVTGQAPEARKALEMLALAHVELDVIACTPETASWPLFDGVAAKFPGVGAPEVLAPRGYGWPNFLKRDNLLNIANQIAVIAILAVGMTMVIITGGIDLSVGSLIALSAVVSTLLIRDAAGGPEASAAAMTLCIFAGIAVCAAMGLFSGGMITLFDIPPFIVTLGMMLVASGLAFTLAQGQSIYEVPDGITWLGREASLAGVPNAVALMILLYIAAYVLMTHTRLGRYIYAVGGNLEAARLSGVRVKAVLVLVYTLCGATAGIGGIVLASQLKSGAPTYGLMYELYVIAAVVVGGTSLRGGEGRILGTLIGAFIIAVIQNGMNLTGVESYTQKVVLGLVILGAVLIDVLRNRGWALLHRAGRNA